MLSSSKQYRQVKNYLVLIFNQNSFNNFFIFYLSKTIFLLQELRYVVVSCSKAEKIDVCLQK